MEVDLGIGLIGWPSHIPKQSTGPMVKLHVETLLQGFKDGSIKFEKISEEKRNAAKEIVRQVFDGELVASGTENIAVKKRKPQAEASMRNLRPNTKKKAPPNGKIFP